MGYKKFYAIWKQWRNTLESQMHRCCFEKMCEKWKESARDLEIESIFTGVALQINQSNKRRVFLCNENYKLTMRHVQYPYGEHNRFSAADIDRALAKPWTFICNLMKERDAKRRAHARSEKNREFDPSILLLLSLSLARVHTIGAFERSDRKSNYCPFQPQRDFIKQSLESIRDSRRTIRAARTKRSFMTDCLEEILC